MSGDSIALPQGCKIPDGYRRLLTGEYKQKGDLYFVGGHWERTAVWNVQVNKFAVVIRPVHAKSKHAFNPLSLVPSRLLGNRTVPTTAERVKEYLKKLNK